MVRMLLFAHTGLTLGLAMGMDNLHYRWSLGKSGDSSSNPHPASVTNPIDYRLVLVGSMLPDIIDKPLGIYIFVETFSNGRIFAHTLLFFLVISIIGLLFHYWRHGKLGILTLSLCSGFHLVLDQMWRIPQTLLWPIYGPTFPKAELGNWLPHIINALHTESTVYIPEIMGFVLLITFGVVLFRRGSFLPFLKGGVVRWTNTTL